MTHTGAPILLADDQPDILEALRLLLKDHGFRTMTASSVAAALGAVKAHDLSLVLMDLNYARDTTSGAEGFELLDRIRDVDSTLPVLVMTAWATIGGAVEALRRGAKDYVEKPWDPDRLVATIRTQLEFASVVRKSRRLELEASRDRAHRLPTLIADAPAMAPILRLLEQVSPSDANVLVLGEHGTGKEVIARLVHERSLRASRPFVALDAGGLAQGVFESELFGHVRGAFTDARADRAGCFELADTGTLFLDEVGNVPLAQQTKLLRVLQTGEFHPVGSSRGRRSDVRVIAATNVALAEEATAGRFREDLLYRLNTIEIRLPPLRERVEDIPLLAEHFRGRMAARYQKDVERIAPAAIRALRDHAWPGNVRELEHVIERAVLVARGDEITQDDLALRRTSAVSPPLENMTLEQIERHFVERAVARAGGNISSAAAALGLSRSALYRRLEQYGIQTG